MTGHKKCFRKKAAKGTCNYFPLTPRASNGVQHLTPTPVTPSSSLSLFLWECVLVPLWGFRGEAARQFPIEFLNDALDRHNLITSSFIILASSFNLATLATLALSGETLSFTVLQCSSHLQPTGSLCLVLIYKKPVTSCYLQPQSIATSTSALLQQNTWILLINKTINLLLLCNK